MELNEMWFGTDVVNRTGRKNIRGDELAALIAAASGGPSAQVGKGCAVQRAPSEVITDGFPGVEIIWTGFPNPFYDDLGFFDSGDPTRLTIPDVDPPIERVLLTASTVWTSDGSSAIHANIISSNVGISGLDIQGNVASADAPVSTRYLNVAGGPYAVNAGDFFELRCVQFSSPSASKTMARANMSILVVK